LAPEKEREKIRAMTGSGMAQDNKDLWTQNPLRATDHVGPDPRSRYRLEEVQGPLPLQTLAAAADGSTEGEDIGLKLTS